MASIDDSDVPETGAVFTFGRSRFADNLANKFWIRNDKIVQVACGDEHSVVVTERGRLYAFGSNDWGQLGLGHTKNANKPSFIKSLKTDKMVSAACGRTHTVAASADGKIYSFGAGGDGQLGHGDTEDQVSPKQIAGLPIEKVKMISCGVYHSAVLFESGDLYIWGTSGDGQTGLEEEEVFRPMSLKFEDSVSWVACGYYHTAVVTESGKLYTFGENENGKLGLSESQLSDTSRPQPVATKDGYFTAVACGAGHTIALTKDGKVFSFGDGSRGQLGQGTRAQELREPKVIQQLSHLKAKYVSCGDCHTAVITENGRLYTFGDGRHGKLGQGEECFSNQFRPVKVTRFENFMVESVSCGGCHTLVTAVLRDPDMSDEEEDAEDGVLNASMMSSYSHVSMDEANATMRPFGLANTVPLISPRDKRRKKESENLANSFSGSIGQFHKSGSLSLDRSRLPQIPKLRDMKETTKIEKRDIKRDETARKKPPVISKTEKDVVEEQNRKNSQKDVDELKRRIEDELDDEETQRAKTKKEKEKGKAKEEEEESEEEESGENDDDETEEESEEEEDDETKKGEGKKKGVISKEKEQQKQQSSKPQAKQEEEGEEEGSEEEGSEEGETDEETEEDEDEGETAVKSKDKVENLVKLEKEDAVKKEESEKMVKKKVTKEEEEEDDDEDDDDDDDDDEDDDEDEDEDDEEEDDDDDDDDDDEEEEDDDEDEEEEVKVKGKKDKDSDSKKEGDSKKEVKIKEDIVEEETKSSTKDKEKDKKEKDKKGKVKKGKDGEGKDEKGKDKQNKGKKNKDDKEEDDGEGSEDENKEKDTEKELNNNDDEIKDGNKEAKTEETQPPKKSKFGNLFGGKKKQAPPPKVEQTATEQTAKDEVDGPVKVTEQKKSGKSGVCVIL